MQANDRPNFQEIWAATIYFISLEIKNPTQLTKQLLNR